MVYILQDAYKLTKSSGIKATEAGADFRAYECTYGRCTSGYERSLYAKTIGAQRFPLNVRMVAIRGLEIRYFDMDSAHFNISVQTVGELVIDIEGSYFKLDHVREYLKNMQKARQVSAAEYKDDIRRPPQFFKKICASAFRGVSAPVAR